MVVRHGYSTRSTRLTAAVERKARPLRSYQSRAPTKVPQDGKSEPEKALRMRASISAFAVALAAMACAASACGGANTAIPQALQAAGGAPNFVHPQVVQKGLNPRDWTRTASGIPPSEVEGYPNALAGPNKSLWFANEYAGTLRRVSMAENRESLGTTYDNYAIGLGTDKNFYMYDGASIAVETTGGTVVTYPIPSGDTGGDGGFTVGPDNDIWFAEQEHIGTISATGTITEYPYPTDPCSPGTSIPNYYGSVTTGPDGNVWYTGQYLATCDYLGMVDVATGVLTDFLVPNSGCVPVSIISAQDGDLWFNCVSAGDEGVVGRITTAGVVTLFAGGPPNDSYGPGSMVRGPDGNPWYIGFAYDGSKVYPVISEIDTSTQVVTSYVSPRGDGYPESLVYGPDGNFWILTSSGEFDVFILKVLDATPSSVSLTGPGKQQTLKATETGGPKLTAKSSDTKIATVKAGTAKNTFVVTAVATGSCNVTISDDNGNTFAVAVTIK
jgi:streptogramin lyase